MADGKCGLTENSSEVIVDTDGTLWCILHLLPYMCVLVCVFM